jgi:hypothetical protein
MYLAHRKVGGGRGVVHTFVLVNIAYVVVAVFIWDIDFPYVFFWIRVDKEEGLHVACFPEKRLAAVGPYMLGSEGVYWARRLLRSS